MEKAEPLWLDQVHGATVVRAERVGTRPGEAGCDSHQRRLKQGRPFFGVALAILDAMGAELPWDGVTPGELVSGTSPLAMLSATDDPGLQLATALRFVRESDTGMVHVNHGTNSEAHMPFGGVKGSGLVVEQNPGAGENIKSGDTLSLVFSPEGAGDPAGNGSIGSPVVNAQRPEFPPTWVVRNGRVLDRGDLFTGDGPWAVLDPDELVATLVHRGYRREELVEHRGEVAKRGAIVDIFRLQNGKVVERLKI